MTPEEIKEKRDALQAEMQTSVDNVSKQLKNYDLLFYLIKIVSLVLAALVAFEPVFRSLTPNFGILWDICALLVLLLLLLELGLRPDDKRKEKLDYVERTKILVKSASFVDPSDPNALKQLDEINRSRG